MLSLGIVGVSALREKQLKKLSSQDNERAGISKQTGIPTQVPFSGAASHQALTAHQANALKLLAFAGKNPQARQTVKLERDFIHTLRRTDDHIEKSSVADILGRAKSIPALPHLLKLLDEKEHPRVRATAASAIANIGSFTHGDGYTAMDLSQKLWDTYQERRAALQKEIETPTQDLSYEDKLKREEEHEERFDEINALVEGVSQLDVVRTNKELLKEFRTRLQTSQEKEATVQELSHQKNMAEDAFHQSLQERYHKPLSELLKEIPSDQLKEMEKSVIVASPGGKEMSLTEMTEQIDQMKLQQEKFDLKLVGSLMDALGYHNDREVNAALKNGLESDHHSIRSRALDLLADRHILNYSTDVYPNLTAGHPEVRQSALQALLNSHQSAATQKALELTNPTEFFKLAGGVDHDSLAQYVGFLSDIAERGDKYVESLSSKAMNPDYSTSSRQISLEVLGMMSRAPIAKLVSPETVMQARMTLKMAALASPGKTSADKAAIATTATTMWVYTGDPTAIHAAVQLADTKEHKTSGKDQERLLAAVVTVLTQDEQNRNKASEKNNVAGHVLDVLKSGHHGLLTAAQEKELRVAIRPEHSLKRVLAESPEDFAEENANEPKDEALAEKLKPTLDDLRPALTSLAESNKSLNAQLLAFRVMGLLKDKDTVRYLMDRVNNPLKGQIDWNADVSYRGNPSMDGLRIRLNALKALGDIGDPKALKVMTPLLEDANIRRAISEPLSKLAPEANKSASEAELKSVRTKLSKLMADPDTGRGMRAVRLRAANALYQFNGGVDAIKEYIKTTTDPNFKRHAISALITNNHGLEPEHPDYSIVKDLTNPGLGVDRLHAKGITGKGVDMGIVDGGFVDEANKEAFQSRVKLPAQWDGDPEDEHPTMVMSTAAANGKLKGVAPEARVFSDKWPAFDSGDPMEVYKKMIEGKMRGENNICVINNSWGFSNQNIVLHKDVRNILKEFKNVVDMAEKAGIQIVFAAGNEGEQPPFPELGTMTLFGLDVDKLTDDQKRNYNYILDKVITVGAMNTQGSEKRADHKMAEFSSVGDSTRCNKMKPTVIAPGADMMVYGWDKVKGNPKTLVNGTSFASPYVSGLITLLAQVNPSLTPKDIREILKKSSVKLANVPVGQQGHGEVNPEAAVRMAENYKSGKKAAEPAQQPTPPADSPPPAAPTGGDVEMTDVSGLSTARHVDKGDKKRGLGLADPDSARITKHSKRPRLLGNDSGKTHRGGKSVSFSGGPQVAQAPGSAFDLLG